MSAFLSLWHESTQCALQEESYPWPVFVKPMRFVILTLYSVSVMENNSAKYWRYSREARATILCKCYLPMGMSSGTILESDSLFNKYTFTMWFTNFTSRYLPTLHENICSYNVKLFYHFKGLKKIKWRMCDKSWNLAYKTENTYCLPGILQKKFASLCSGVNIRDWVAGLCDICMFDFLRNSQIVFQSGCYILHPPQQYIRDTVAPDSQQHLVRIFVAAVL